MVLSLKRKKNSATLDNFDGTINKYHTASRSQIGHKGSLQYGLILIVLDRLFESTSV